MPQRQKCMEKPMGELDFQRVEQELQQQLNPVASLQPAGLQHTHGWSTAPLGEYYIFYLSNKVLLTYYLYLY